MQQNTLFFSALFLLVLVNSFLCGGEKDLDAERRDIATKALLAFMVEKGEEAVNSPTSVKVEPSTNYAGAQEKEIIRKISDQKVVRVNSFPADKHITYSGMIIDLPAGDNSGLTELSPITIKAINTRKVENEKLCKKGNPLNTNNIIVIDTEIGQGSLTLMTPFEAVPEFFPKDKERSLKWAYSIKIESFLRIKKFSTYLPKLKKESIAFLKKQRTNKQSSKKS